MSVKATFCFIDDAEFELANFRENAAFAFSRAEFVYAKTFEETVDSLKGRRPVCFLLDLYGADPQEDLSVKPEIPDPAWLADCLGPRAETDDLFQGLGQAGDEAGNLFLRRLYARVEKWQSVFQAAAGKLGQSRAYGLANLAAVRKEYPWAAAVGYSRKALYADAAAAGLAGMDGVLQKPQGVGDRAIAQATSRVAPDLAGAVYRAVDKRLSLVIAPLVLKICQNVKQTDLTKAVCQGLELLGAHDNGPSYMGLQKTLKALAPEVMSRISMDKQKMETISAMRSWLASCEQVP